MTQDRCVGHIVFQLIEGVLASGGPVEYDFLMGEPHQGFSELEKPVMKRR